MTNAPKQNETKSGSILPLIVLPAAFVLGYLIYKFVFGAASHFKDGDNTKDPLAGDYMGMVYKGGFIVPVLLGLLFITIIFSVERMISISRASGNGPVDKFVRNVQYALSKGDVSGAIAACDKQKGSVANVVRSGITTYDKMSRETGMDKDQKIAAIQKEIEEATSLELPSLEQNLPTTGAPDASALANGISEALINTALGITTSAIAIVAYSYFTTRIDGMTYRIDEAGYSMQQQFASQYK